MSGRGSAIRPLLATVPFLAAVALSACGGDGAPASPTPGATAQPSPAPGETATVSAPTIPGPSLDLAAESPRLTVSGMDSGDFGEGLPSVSHGDFNGDGLADILIGAPFADGPDNSRDGAGEAYVIFGSPDLPESLDLADAQQGVSIFGGAEGDALGFSVLGGDVNGDGIDDVMVGAPGATGTEDPRTDQGEVYIFFGSTDFGGTLDIADAPESVRITGAEGFSRLGHAIAAGDVNGDGTDDIVLGGPFAGREPGTPPGSPRTEVGEAYVIFGGPDLEGYVSIISGQQDFTISGAQQFGQFGAAVAAADLNGDEIDDIVVGASQSDGPEGAPEAAGTVYVFLGAEDLRGRISIAEGGGDVTIVGAGERDNLGFPLAAGDFNGDGFGDVAMGARGVDAPTGDARASGAVYITFGRADLAGAGIQAPDAAIYGSQASQLLPSSLASGDLNGDNTTDLVIGSGFGSGSSERSGSGIAYIILGKAGFAGAELADGGQDLAIVGMEERDSLGSAVALASVTGSGRPELILLAAGADSSDNARTDAGEIYLVDAGPLGD